MKTPTSWCRVLTAALALAGCEPTPAPAPIAPVPIVSAPPTASVTAPPPAAPPAPAIADLTITAPSEEPACTMKESSWYGDMSLEPEASPFATAIEIGATLELAHKGQSIFARIFTDTMRIEVWTKGQKVYLARALPLSRVVFPKESTELGWKGAERTGAVVVSLDTSNTLADPAIATTELACGDLSLTSGKFDMRSNFPKTPKNAEKIAIVATPLSDKPGSAPVARTSGDELVEVLARTKKDVKVLIEAPDYFVVGWVPASKIDPDTRIGGMFGVGSPNAHYAGPMSVPSSHNRGCSVELPLFVEIPGKRARVGTLLAAVAFSREDSAPGDAYIPIHVYGRQWIRFVDKGRLVVAAKDLDHCNK